MILRNYQQAALDALWDYMQAHDGNPALVLPTGSVKSPLMAAIARDAVEKWQGRVGIIAHVAELVSQNADKLRALWPDAPMGLYAAGLGKRDRFEKILVMQIQSVCKRAHALGHFDLLLIDEAHRIPLHGEGRYLQFIADCKKINPQLRVVGLTATPYRLQGQAVPVCGRDHVLTDIAFEASVGELIEQGFLSTLVSKAGDRPDLGTVHVRGGEYIDAELATAMLPLVPRTVDDMLARAHGRRAGIVFCVTVEHAEAVVQALRARGETAAIVHGGTPKAARATLIEAYQAGAIRWMVNVNVLSEGFDAPQIDCVAMLRPTKSPGLYYQQVGRGFRLYPGKTDCLVLDYAGNVLEHGPVDAIRVRPKKTGATVQTGSAKECPQCSTLLNNGVRTCPECGHVFAVMTPDHMDTPVDAPVLSSQRERVLNHYTVTTIKYERGEGKNGKPDHLRAIHQCGIRRFTDYVCIEHSGRARAEAVRWWTQRSGGHVPRTVADALDRAHALATPSVIQVDETERFPRIVGVEFCAEDTQRSTPAWLAEKLMQTQIDLGKHR